ncbi:MAG: DMT family transporter [Pseudomonadota bacterium]
MENLRGMAWMTLAMFCFAVADMFIVFAAGEISVGLVVLMFGLFGTPLLAVLARVQGIPLISPALRSRALWARNLAEMTATCAVVLALSLIPFSTFSAILQASPLIVTLGAAVFLREVVGWRRWTAILLGLCGVLMILRPGTAAFEPALLVAVFGVLALSARDLITRFVPREIPSVVIATCGFASTVPAGLLLTLALGDVSPPSLAAVGYIATSSVFGAVAYLSITNAMRLGEISVVTPFRYTRLIFAFVIAYIIFDEVPDGWTWFGAALVVATGLYTILREGRRKEAAPDPSAGVLSGGGTR